MRFHSRGIRHGTVALLAGGSPSSPASATFFVWGSSGVRVECLITDLRAAGPELSMMRCFRLASCTTANLLEHGERVVLLFCRVAACRRHFLAANCGCTTGRRDDSIGKGGPPSAVRSGPPAWSGPLECESSRFSQAKPARPRKSGRSLPTSVPGDRPGRWKLLIDRHGQH